MDVVGMSKEITVSEAAQRLGCKLHPAYALVYANLLRSRKVLDRWSIPPGRGRAPVKAACL
jgi:hypothetical protein